MTYSLCWDWCGEMRSIRPRVSCPRCENLTFVCLFLGSESVFLYSQDQEIPTKLRTLRLSECKLQVTPKTVKLVIRRRLKVNLKFWFHQTLTNWMVSCFDLNIPKCMPAANQPAKQHTNHVQVSVSYIQVSPKTVQLARRHLQINLQLWLYQTSTAWCYSLILI